MKPIISSSYSIVFNQDGYSELNLIINKNNYSKVFLFVDENTEKHCLPLLDKKVDFSFQIIISSLSWLVLRTLKEGRKAFNEVNKESK